MLARTCSRSGACCSSASPERPAFVGDNMMAVLAKILLEDAPRLSDACAATCPPTSMISSRGCSQEPRRAPRGRRERARAARRARDPRGRSGRTAAQRPPPALTVARATVVCVVMAARRPRAHRRARTDGRAHARSRRSASSQQAVAVQGASSRASRTEPSSALIAGQGTPRDEAARAAPRRTRHARCHARGADRAAHRARRGHRAIPRRRGHRSRGPRDAHSRSRAVRSGSTRSPRG